MKLYCAYSSPYSRKARAAAFEAGVADQIELIVLNPWDNPPALLEVNPLGRIPVLVTDDLVLFDSAVIAEFLDSIGSGRLFPREGAARWRTLKRLAIGDGILEALVPVRLEWLRPEEHRSKMLDERWRKAAGRALSALEAENPEPADGDPDIGDIAIGCGLGYIDFRFPDWDWRRGNPKLAAWYGVLSARPSFVTTIPS